MELIETHGDTFTSVAIDIAAALVILVGGWIVSKWIAGTIRTSLSKASNVDQTLAAPLSKAAHYALMVLVFIAALSQAGVETTSLFAVLGAAGLAVGLALQGTLANVSAGIMLLFLRPLRTGEFIDAEGLVGTVEEVGLFTTQLKTVDGIFLTVPNATIWARSIKNYSRLPTRRVDVVVGIAYDDDVSGALAALLDEVRSDERVLKDPEPETMVVALADSSVNINVRCWVQSANYWPVFFDLHKNAKVRVEKEGYSIPFPQQDVHFPGGGPAGGPGGGPGGAPSGGTAESKAA